jgi:hypothetical protein
MSTNVTPKDPRLNPAMTARVDAARLAWDARPSNGNRKVFASFDDLLDAFASDCMRFSDIGVALGVSREWVRQLWRDHFAHLFRGKTGQQRQRACTIASRRDMPQLRCLSARRLKQRTRRSATVALPRRA